MLVSGVTRLWLLIEAVPTAPASSRYPKTGSILLPKPRLFSDLFHRGAADIAPGFARVLLKSYNTPFGKGQSYQVCCGAEPAKARQREDLTGWKHLTWLTLPRRSSLEVMTL